MKASQLEILKRYKIHTHQAPAAYRPVIADLVAYRTGNQSAFDSATQWTVYGEDFNCLM